MIQEVYNISREAMESLQSRLRNPSREQALLREAMMRKLHAEIHSSFSGSTEISSFDNLDLSFLQEPQTNTQFVYSQMHVSDRSPFFDIMLGDIFGNCVAQSYGNEDNTMAAA